MATCKNCLHVGVCKAWDSSGEIQKDNYKIFQNCPHFKDRSRFVELPCKIGNKLYLSTESRDKILHLLSALTSDPELFEIVPEKQIKQALAEQEQRNNTN